jgi:hypothetical protein
MLHSGFGPKPNLAAGFGQAFASIDFLEVHKEALVHAAEVVVVCSHDLFDLLALGC